MRGRPQLPLPQSAGWLCRAQMDWTCPSRQPQLQYTQSKSKLFPSRHIPKNSPVRPKAGSSLHQLERSQQNKVHQTRPSWRLPVVTQPGERCLSFTLHRVCKQPAGVFPQRKKSHFHPLFTVPTQQRGLCSSRNNAPFGSRPGAENLRRGVNFAEMWKWACLSLIALLP